MFQNSENASEILTNFPALVSALVGSAFAVYRNPKKSWRQNLVTIIVGTVSAVTLTPIIIDQFNFGIQWENGVAFFVGLVGMRICEYVIDNFNSILESIIKNKK